MRIFGKRSVTERIRLAPKTVKRVYLRGDSDIGHLLRMAKKAEIDSLVLLSHQFDKITRNINTQGVFAEVEEFSYVPLEDLLEASKEKPKTLLFLDRISDPQNLGAIMRSAACLGDFAIVLPRYESVPVTEAVLRVASGAENYIPVCQVANLHKSLIILREYGYSIAAGVVSDGEDVTGVKFNFPLCLIIGSESKGIKTGLLKDIDLKVTLPMLGARLSFNVAVATALFCYEITRQRRKHNS